MSTIIKHKQFPKNKKWTMDLCGRPLTIEVGKVAELASASAMVKYGETTVMVAVTVSPRPRDGVDFFPLTDPSTFSRLIAGYRLDRPLSHFGERFIAIAQQATADD